MRSPRRRIGRWPLAVGLLVLVAGLLPWGAPSFVGPVAAQTTLPPLPAGWPTTLQLGMSDSPGGAAALRATAPFAFRYQYLAGGVNTGGGWATWNPNGEFVTFYIQDSVQHGFQPVFTYYMIRQSAPGNAQDESPGVLANLQNTATMTAYYNDLKLFFQRAGAFPNTRTVLHVEPDMWGYIQQRVSGDNAANQSVQVASTGLSELAGLPNNASGLARAIVRLRDQYAPNVLLGYHVSVWGTGVDIGLSDPPDATVQSLATRAGNFYQSLGASFDLAFGEFSDRDAAFKQFVYGDGGASWWNAEDFRRNALFLSTFAGVAQKRLVIWQIPLGNTRMRAMNNTWNHYQDNRVEWLLDDPTRAHLDAYLQAGVVAFLFGRGADGATCACDAAGDGVTNPAPINGNNRQSLSADDDGGFFRERAAAYYATGAMPLPASGSSPTPTATPNGTRTPTPAPSPTTAPVDFATSATATPGSVARGATVNISAAVTSATALSALVDVEVYDPAGAQVHQQFWDNQTFAAGQTRTYPLAWTVPTAASTGTYTIKMGVFTPGWGALHDWNNSAGQFSVVAAATATATPSPTPSSAPTATRTATTAPTTTSTATATRTATTAPSNTPTATATTAPSNTPTATATHTATTAPSNTSTATATRTATTAPSNTPTATTTHTATTAPSNTPTATATHTATATTMPPATATATPSRTPTATSVPASPTVAPSATPSSTAVPPSATATRTSTATPVPSHTAVPPTTTPTATATSVTCPTGQWRAEYFNNRTLSAPAALIRCETSIANDWGLGAPPGVPVAADNFSVRWTGRHSFSAGGHMFVGVTDDGLRAWLDNTLIIDAWWDQGPTEYRAARTLTAGDHDLKVEFYENGGGATAHFRWESSVTCPTGLWRAEYFANVSLSGSPALVRCEAQIANDWGLGAPPGVPVAADNFSVRWTGRHSFGANGYTFSGITDDGLRAWLDNTLIIDAWWDQGPTEYRATRTLTAGDHDLRVEFYENGGGATAHFHWESSVTCPTGQWRAEYFNNRTLSAPAALIRCETSIANDWGLGAPPGVPVPADNFSVRWTGRHSFSAGGHTFVGITDDGLRAWLDNTLIIDAWWDQGPTEYRATRTLTAGDHDLRVEFYERGGGATAHFRWESSVTCPTGQWRAEYFANVSLSGSPALVRCEAQIANDWGLGAPPGVPVPADNFSVRWTGRHSFSAGGRTFVGLTDDGLRAWLDNTLIIDAWRDQGPTEYRAARTLTAGEHELKVEFYERGGGATAHFRWE